MALNDSDVDGRQVFSRYCASCHTLKGANAVGTVGPNLDEMRPPKALILDAIANGRARGQGQMPANVVDGEDAENVANFIVKVARALAAHRPDRRPPSAAALREPPEPLVPSCSHTAECPSCRARRGWAGSGGPNFRGESPCGA